MKVDPQSVQTGIGVLGLLAAFLAPWRVRLLRIFAVSLGMFLLFEWFCLASDFEPFGWFWWLVHLPSALLLGVDEILEIHGKTVSTVFHLGDLLLWAATVTMVCWCQAAGRIAHQSNQIMPSTAESATRRL